jgi:hypothetical protein
MGLSKCDQAEDTSRPLRTKRWNGSREGRKAAETERNNWTTLCEDESIFLYDLVSRYVGEPVRDGISNRSAEEIRVKHLFHTLIIPELQLELAR